MLPFRSHPPTPLLQEGYSLVADPFPSAEALNRLLVLGGDQPREADRWQRVLERSIWHLGVKRSDGELMGFVRATSDLALNANLWDLCWDPADPASDEVLASLCTAPSAGCVGSFPDAVSPSLPPPPRSGPSSATASSWTQGESGPWASNFTRQGLPTTLGYKKAPPVPAGRAKRATNKTSMEGLEPPTLRTGI